MKKSRTHELEKRLLFSILILAIYMVGRSLLLYQVDSTACQIEEVNSQNIMVSMISGDRYQYTLFALGVMPYITATLAVWVLTAIGGKEFRERLSPQKRERITRAVMLVIAAAFAVSRADELVFIVSDLDVRMLKAIAALEMTAGAAVIYKMADFNKEHGIGGHTPIILVNIVDNLISTVRKFSWQELQNPLLLCLIVAVVVFSMENIMLRMPVQRVSIHNEYADQSYIALKLDPIGVMPVMFAISFFMIPQLAVRYLLFVWKDNEFLQMIGERMNLTDPVGAAVYLGIILFLNVSFSFLMISPGDIAEQLQKGGDSIVGIYAGRKTRRYLRRQLLLLSVLSSAIFCLLMGISLGVAMRGETASELALLPATVMMQVGIFCSLYREVRSYRKFDSYSFFI